MKTIILALSLGSLLLVGCSSDIESSEAENHDTLTISHAHGLAVDQANPERLLVATHEGLVSWENGTISEVGEAKDDLMGFVPHPRESQTFYSSGHPRSGGNLGFQKTTDGGQSWKIMSEGVGGPVDFHAMTVSEKNPYIVYGWYGGSLQRSTDGGESWEIVDTDLKNVITLNATTKNADTVYAGTTNGILVSQDKGESWSTLSEELSEGAVIVVAPDPTNPESMISFSEKLGLAKSQDGGQSWTSTQADFGEDFPMYMSYNLTDTNIVYLITMRNILYKSTDGGNNWSTL